MELVIFIHKDSSKKGIILKKGIEKCFDNCNLCILQTYNTLKSRLKIISGNAEEEIFLLLADSKNRLGELTALIELLENKRTVLIIPDESRETISMVSQFFPRFFTPISDTYEDLCSVLNKMISRKKINKNNIRRS